MIQMTTKYLGSLRTEATHLKSGNRLITDAPTDNNGKGEAFSPTDLLCTALASCMMTLMGIYAQRHEIDLTGMTSDITKIMSSQPRKVQEVKIHFTLENFSSSKRHIQGLKKAALSCPVALSLNEDLQQTITFSF